jgi:pimeloyl-ACP methyl ester carboxylesterase
MTKPASAKNPVPQVSVASIAREATRLIEIPKLALELRRLRDEPRGSGLPVRVFPGLGARDQSTWPLRRFLNLQGHRAKGWGLGSNIRDVLDTVKRLGELTQKWAERSGGPVSLVGWSLEGYIAREVARDDPNSVRRVVTFGSLPSRAGFQRRRVSRRCAAFGGG